ncbi:MAG TPA: UDP-N-acetylglucosamine 1-carboxyvinyltransferase [Ignavibacteriales bacterium]|nr:UDP-N-acetylglucosamine 1-carboxyvinyltransferase [Ignavibacteriales bacterium]
MDKFVITGGKALKGKVSVSGAKNAALAIMPAALLNAGANVLYNTPEVNDVYTMIKLLNNLGVETDFKDFTLKFDTSNITSQVAPYEHVKKMRASVYVLGPLLSRFGYAKVSLPGGCAWGPRPINLHLEGLKKMGAEIELEEGYIIAKADKLKGARISFDVSSVGATGNLMMAATLAKGTTVITNAAIEPEITVLAEYLQKMGARIQGVNTSVLEIEGVDELKAAETTNIPDRIEAGTLLIAGAITRGTVELRNFNPDHLSAVLVKLEDSGAKLSINKDSVMLDASDLETINPVDVSTSIYPGFPTDMQAQWTSLMALAGGVSTVTDSIYLDRFKHVPELNRLGANIEIRENSVVIHGVPRFKGAKVMSTDLRASASLVLAGLAAEGETEVLRIYHLDRGYQRIEEKLMSMGAQIERVAGAEY